jgi:hypothetical protein
VAFRRPGVVALSLLALVLPLYGCGDDSGDDAADAPPPPARPKDFPKPAGESLAGLLKRVGSEGPVLAASVSQMSAGENRFGFGLFDRARAQIADAPVALYVAPVGGGKASGPYVARYESLKVKPQFQSKTVADDPSAARSLYVADLELPKPGRYEVLGVARLDGRLVAAKSAGPPLLAQTRGGVPNVGDKAPIIHTQTKGDVGGAIQKIDTRQPPSTMHDVDFADVVGKKPTILLFATPALCQSRVCGPVADVAEQVKAKHGDDLAWAHQEIFRDNEVSKGFRAQVTAYRLPTEPWLFAVDRNGRVAARIEGAFSVDELEAAVAKALKGA